MENRRRFERVRAPKIQVRVATLERLRTMYLEDLSQGGIFIRTEKTLPVGSPVEVELVPPDMPPLPLSGSVARVVVDEEAKREKRAGMGVKFESLTPDSERALADLISRLKQPAAAPAPEAPPMERTERGVSELEMELADLKGKLEAYEVLQRQLELDEDTSRRLAERLARERSEEKSRAEQAAERFAIELAGLRGELAAARQRADEATKKLPKLAELEEELEATRQAQATTEAALDAERREHENTMSELTALQKKGGASSSELKEAKDALEVEKRRAARLQESLDEERLKADAARAKEREVRQLLSLVSGDNSPESTPTRLIQPSPPPAPEPVHESKPEPEPESEPEPETALAPPPVAAAPPGDVPEDFDISFQEPVAIPDNLPSPKEPGNGEGGRDLASFAERLRKAVRIQRTDRYHTHKPTDPAEIYIFDLLSRVQTLEELAKWTQGRVTRERLVQIVYEFQSRSLIDLE